MTGVLWRDERTDKGLRDELDARHPERLKLRPRDEKGLREAFTVLEDLWAPTIARARNLSPPKLDERVNGEYSFVETLRHLLFVWDAWLVPEGYHAWGIPPELPGDAPSPVMWSRSTGWAPLKNAPDLDAVLVVRDEYFARVRDFLATATPDDVGAPGSPPPWRQGEASVLYCMRVVLHDEWWHHQFAVRDLAVLEHA
jgi:hypothetical protein